MNNTPEIPDNIKIMSSEELTEVYAEIKDLLNDEEKFKSLLMELQLMETVFSQINDVFIERLYNPKASAPIGAANQLFEKSLDSIRKNYISASKELGKPIPIPELENLVEWVTTIHENIFRQLLHEEYVDLVIVKSLNDIGDAIVEFAEEEPQETELQGDDE
jgi:hypothetical protein